MQSETAALRAALPDYQVGERLGQGQFGVVWAARHRRLGREVAVKQLTGTALADPRNKERFRREARLLARLDHRHVVRVYDYREAGDLSLLIMERLTGGTLSARRAAGLTDESIIVAVIAAASGLHHLHLAGVLHRDVKPANLMFDRHDLVKVTDFGTARGHSPLTGRPDPTHLAGPGPAAVGTGGAPHPEAVDVDSVEVSFAGEFLGTPGFTAPEQAAAAVGLAAVPVGPAADQYALAAVLYQLLTGSYTHPVEGGTLALLTRRATSDATPADLADPAGLQRATQVMMRALARRPEDRFGSVEQFGLALAAAAAADWGPRWVERSTVTIAEPGPLWDAVHAPPGRPITPPAESRPGTTRGTITVPGAPAGPPAREPGATGATGRRSRRRFRRLLAFLLAAAVLIASAAVVVVLTRGDTTTGDDSAASGPTDTAAAPLAVTADWAYRTGGEVFASPTVAGEVVIVGSKDGTVYGIDRATGAGRWQVPTGGPIRTSAAVDGGLAIVGSDDGIIRALWVTTGQPAWTATIGYQIVSTPAVADGLVFVGADRLYALDTSSGRQVWAFTPGDVIVSSPTIAGDLVIVGSNDGFLYGISRADGTHRWRLDTGGPVLASPVAVDGVAYVGSRSGDLLAVTAATGQLRWKRPLGAAVNGAAAVTDRQVIAGTTAGTVASLGAADGTPRWTWSTTGQIDGTPAVLDEGTLVVGSSSSAVHLLDTGTGAPVGEFVTGGPVLSSPRVADGQIFVGSYDDSVYRLRVGTP